MANPILFLQHDTTELFITTDTMLAKGIERSSMPPLALAISVTEFTDWLKQENLYFSKAMELFDEKIANLMSELAEPLGTENPLNTSLFSYNPPGKSSPEAYAGCSSVRLTEIRHAKIIECSIITKLYMISILDIKRNGAYKLSERTSIKQFLYSYIKLEHEVVSKTAYEVYDINIHLDITAAYAPFSFEIVTDMIESLFLDDDKFLLEPVYTSKGLFLVVLPQIEVEDDRPYQYRAKLLAARCNVKSIQDLLETENFWQNYHERYPYSPMITFAEDTSTALRWVETVLEVMTNDGRDLILFNDFIRDYKKMLTEKGLRFDLSGIVECDRVSDLYNTFMSSIGYKINIIRNHGANVNVKKKPMVIEVMEESSSIYDHIDKIISNYKGSTHEKYFLPAIATLLRKHYYKPTVTLFKILEPYKAKEVIVRDVEKDMLELRKGKEVSVDDIDLCRYLAGGNIPLYECKEALYKTNNDIMKAAELVKAQQIETDSLRSQEDTAFARWMRFLDNEGIPYTIVEDKEYVDSVGVAFDITTLRIGSFVDNKQGYLVQKSPEEYASLFSEGYSTSEAITIRFTDDGKFINFKASHA